MVCTCRQSAAILQSTAKSFFCVVEPVVIIHCPRTWLAGMQSSPDEHGNWTSFLFPGFFTKQVSRSSSAVQIRSHPLLAALWPPIFGSVIPLACHCITRLFLSNVGIILQSALDYARVCAGSILIVNTDFPQIFLIVRKTFPRFQSPGSLENMVRFLKVQRR